MEVNTILNRAPWLAVLAALTLPARAAPMAAQSAAPCDAGQAGAGPVLHVTATGTRRIAGEIAFTLYGADPARFLKSRGSLAIVRVPLASSSAEACFALAVAGDYAVAIYHDENGNHRWDRNFLGLPAEGYGFSNDAPTYLGPPAYAAARIAVHPGDNRITVRLRY